MLLPVIGPLPQISHRCAIFEILLEVPTQGLNFITQVALFFKYERRSRPCFFRIGGQEVPTQARNEGGYFVVERRRVVVDIPAAVRGIVAQNRGLAVP
jgi:hypothetical protein